MKKPQEIILESIKLALTEPSGHVHVMTFITKQGSSYEPYTRTVNDEEIHDAGDGWENPPTEENILRVLAKFPYPIASWREIQPKEIPTDRTFRNAWTYDDKFDVDMPKAREIHRANLRTERMEKFKELDVADLRAMKSGDTQRSAEIEAEKQRLRDLPAHPDIDAALTPELLLQVKV